MGYQFSVFKLYNHDALHRVMLFVKAQSTGYGGEILDVFQGFLYFNRVSGVGRFDGFSQQISAVIAQCGERVRGFVVLLLHRL